MKELCILSPGLEHVGSPANRFLGAVTSQTCEGAVDPEDVVIPIGNQDAFLCLESRGGDMQFLFGSLALGDIASNDHQPLALPLFAEYRRLARLYNRASAIFSCHDFFAHQQLSGLPSLFIARLASLVRSAECRMQIRQLHLGFALPWNVVQLEKLLGRFIGDQPSSIPILEENRIGNGFN